MAKKKAEDILAEKFAGCIGVVLVIGAILCIVLYAVMYAAAVAYILLPVIFLICLLVIFIIYMRKDRPYIKANFQLSDAEQHSNDVAVHNYHWAKDKLAACEREIQEKGLRRNADGRLSQRSYAGQDVQGAIDNAKKVKDESFSTYCYYQDLIKKRYKTARKHFSRMWALLIALLVFGICFLVVSSQNTDNTAPDTEISIKNTKQIADNQSENLSTDDAQQVEQAEKPLDPYIESIIYMIIAYLIAFSIAYIVFSIKHKKPTD